jgi:hypothetical protein
VTTRSDCRRSTPSRTAQNDARAGSRRRGDNETRRRVSEPTQIIDCSRSHSGYYYGSEDRTSLRGDDVAGRTDNAALTVHKRSSLSTTGKNNINLTLNGSYDTTDLNVSFHPTPTMTGSAQTDIIYGVNPDDVLVGFIGSTWCDAVASDFRCDQHFAKFEFNPSRALACHETGHAVGLTHGSDADPQVSDNQPDFGCMRIPTSDNESLLVHNASQINFEY